MGRLDRFRQAANEFIEERMTESLLHEDDKHRRWLVAELRKWENDLADEFAQWHQMGGDEVRFAVERAL